MSNNEKMNIDEKRKYLGLEKPRYKRAGRKEKGVIALFYLALPD